MIQTERETEPVAAAQTNAAAQQVARGAYAFWINQPLGARDVARALRMVARWHVDPAVRQWASGNHPQVVLTELEQQFREWAEAERRGLGR